MTQPGRAIYTIEINENGQREFIDFEGPSGLSDQDIERLAADRLRTARPGQSFAMPVYAGSTEGGGRPQAEGGEPAQPEQHYNPMAAWANNFIDFGTGVAQGIGETWDRSADLLEGTYNNTLGALIGHESHSADPTRTTSDLIAGRPGMGAAERLAGGLGQGSELGHTVGEIAGTALLTRGLGGPVAQGMGAGAIFSDAETPVEFAGDVVTGGVGGKLGDVAARGARAVLAPAIDRGAQMLRGAGVRMTPGQYLPALREFEDKSMSLPFAGPQLAAQRRQGFQDFARAVPRDALDTVRNRIPGRNIPDFPEGATGQEAVRHAGDQLSTIYEDIIPQLRLQADEPLTSEIQTIASRLRSEPLSDAGREQFERVIDRGIVSRLRGSAATGREYQAADTYLEQQAARFGRSSDPDHQIIADGIRDIRASLRNGIVRQNGRLGQELEAVDEGWAMLVPAEAAAANAPRGFFSPAQYRQQLRAGDSRVRRRGMARGEVRGQEFAEAGQDILPAQMPNPSGTASHEAYSFANPRFYQGAATRLLYGPTTQNALRVATIDRPAALDPLARAIANAINPLPAPQAGALGVLATNNALFGF